MKTLVLNLFAVALAMMIADSVQAGGGKKGGAGGGKGQGTIQVANTDAVNDMAVWVIDEATAMKTFSSPTATLKDIKKYRTTVAKIGAQDFKRKKGTYLVLAITSIDAAMLTEATLVADALLVPSAGLGSFRDVMVEKGIKKRVEITIDGIGETNVSLPVVVP